jgi:zinc-ribbon domain
MNCKVCGAPLQQGARFCPNCGTATNGPYQENIATSLPPSQAPTDNTARILPPEYNSQSAPPWAPTQQVGQPPWTPTQTPPTQESHTGAPVSPFQSAAPLPYYQNNRENRGATMPPTTDNRREMRPKRRRNRAGCAAGCLTVIVILLLVVGAGWIFLLRPYLHNIAETQIDNALTAGVQQIPTTLPVLPTGIAIPPIPITDTTINNLFVLSLSPNDPIKNPAAQITPDGISISFQIYGLGNGISLKPAVQNGHLVATNVGITGPFSLIMSPDELTPLLNRHLADAQNRIKYAIQSVQLKDHEMDLTIGAAQAA